MVLPTLKLSELQHPAVVVVVDGSGGVAVLWPVPRLVSVLARLLVLRVRHREEVLQLPLQRLERRPLHRVLRIFF